ncbi:unnamed protein product [Prunus armeniaca]
MEEFDFRWSGVAPKYMEDETKVQDKSQVEDETGVQDKSQVEDETGMQDKSQVEDETGVEDNVDVEDQDEAEVVDSEEDDGEFVDSDYEFSEEEFRFKTVQVHVFERADDTMSGSNEGPTFEAPGEMSSDGEHTSYFDTESEGDRDDMEGDNEGISKVLKETLREYSIIHGRKLFFEKK